MLAVLDCDLSSEYVIQALNNWALTNKLTDLLTAN